MQNDKTNRERVFLIDAMGHIFRAFFAPMGSRAETLRNSKGQETQAVFVFTNVIRKLLKDEQPHYVAAVFDTSEKTFRHDAYADYKANRADMPDELAAQMPYIIKVCEAFNIPILKMDGFEADDIIGTLAQKFAADHLQAVIVSNDKDMCQLVRDPDIVCLRYNSQNVKRKVPVPPVETCDEAWVLNKFGVPASKIIDLLGLMGDSVDNIPGAPGIGEKGAVNLVQTFGSVEEAMRRADEVKHKTYRESLKNNAEIIRQSLELATIKTDVPIEVELESLRLKEPNREAAYELFRELEFSALTREFAPSVYETPLFERPSMQNAVATERRYKTIDNRADLDTLIRQLWENEHWSLAVADNEFADEPLGAAIATAAGAAYFIDFERFAEGKEAALAPLADTLQNGFLGKAVYDLKRTCHLLAPYKIVPEAVEDDVLLAAYLLDPTRNIYSLNTLVSETIGQEASFDVPQGWMETAYRACEAADFIYQVAPIYRQRLREFGLEKIYTDIEIPIAPILYRIESAGMKIDVEILRWLSESFGEELQKMSARIYELAGHEFNINSPKQVGEVLTELNIAGKRKTATGQVSTSKDVLLELAETYELPRLVVEYREIEKLRSVYTDVLPDKRGADGRIHGQLNQTVTTTGRLSSSDPNLQNIPIRTELGQKIRSAFIPEEGHKLIAADYSQLELRILAHVTKDERLVEAFQNNEDIHSLTAKLVFNAEGEADMANKRRLAKIVNFAIAYAVEAYGLSSRVGLSVAEAKKVITDYYETYKGVKKFMDETPEFARQNGYVASIYGRRRPIPQIHERNFSIRSRAEREAINMPIQGTASDIVKIAMIKVDDALRNAGMKTRMIMQVHDELLLEAPFDEVEKASEIVRREMENAVQLDVPLLVEIGVGDNWMET